MVCNGNLKFHDWIQRVLIAEALKYLVFCCFRGLPSFHVLHISLPEGLTTEVREGGIPQSTQAFSLVLVRCRPLQINLSEPCLYLSTCREESVTGPWYVRKGMWCSIVYLSGVQTSIVVILEILTLCVCVFMCVYVCLCMFMRVCNSSDK